MVLVKLHEELLELFLLEDALNVVFFSELMNEHFSLLTVESAITAYVKLSPNEFNDDSDLLSV